MQVTHAEVLYLVYNNSIVIRNIYTALDYSCCNQSIVIIIYKVEYNLLQLLRVHLSMTNTYPTVRNILLNHCSQVRQVIDSVVHKEYLSVSTHLKVYSFGYYILIECMQLSLNWVSVWRRSLNYRKIPCPHQ